MGGAVQDVCAPLVSVIWSWSSDTGMDETGEGEGFMKIQMAGFQAVWELWSGGRGLHFGSDLPGLSMQGTLRN